MDVIVWFVPEIVTTVSNKKGPLVKKALSFMCQIRIYFSK